MATRMFDRRPAATPADPHERVATIVARHGDLLLRVARHYALCADDAHDAVQRALEIYMRRVDSLDPATELAWLKVVVKHEVAGRPPQPSGGRERGRRPRRRARARAAVGRGALRVQRASRALRRGHAAPEARRGARADAQGRGPLLQRDRRAPRLDLHQGQPLHHRGPAALHAPLRGARDGSRVRAPRPHAPGARPGTASSESLLELRPHLRNCAGCRATVRALHTSHLGRLSAFAAAVFAPARAFVDRLRGGAAAARIHPPRRPSSSTRWTARRTSTSSSAASTAPSPRSSRSRPRWPKASAASQPSASTSEAGPRPHSTASRAPTSRSASTRPARRRRPHHLHRRPDRNLRQRRGSRDLLRRDRSPARTRSPRSGAKRRPRSVRPPRRSSSASQRRQARPSCARRRRSPPEPSATRQTRPEVNTQEPRASPDLPRTGGNPGLLVRADRRPGTGHACRRTSHRRRGVRAMIRRISIGLCFAAAVAAVVPCTAARGHVYGDRLPARRSQQLLADLPLQRLRGRVHSVSGRRGHQRQRPRGHGGPEHRRYRQRTGLLERDGLLRRSIRRPNRRGQRPAHASAHRQLERGHSRHHRKPLALVR